MLQPGTIYCGDNLIKLKLLPDETIDVIYIDPPFNSNRHYELFWGDKTEKIAFDDRFGEPMSYIEWIHPRIRELWRVLKPNGSLFFHCDWHVGHYVKVLLDQIFGRNNFRNEIVWCYNRAGNKRMKNLIRCHDTIFYYAKNSSIGPFYADPVRQPYSASSLSREGYAKKGISGKFKEQICKLNPLGKFPPDWWSDIPQLRPNSKERIGYPTQKPVALIERLLLVSSQEGNVVLDAFCGCGTTLVAAYKLKRQWIGIDLSPTACRVMAHRLWTHVGLQEGRDFWVKDLPKTEDDLRNMHHYDFQNWAVTALGGIPGGKGPDRGVDGRLYLVEGQHANFFSSINSFYPVQAKQRDKVGRPDIDAFETALRRERKQEGYFVAFSFTRDAIQEVERAQKQDEIVIHLIMVEDLIKQAEEQLR